MQKKLKILFIPIPLIGHVNACIGMAQVLVDSGHQVIFYVSDQWKDRLTKYGIEEVLYPVRKINDAEPEKDVAKFWSKIVVDLGILGNETPLQKMLNIANNSRDQVGHSTYLDDLVEAVLPKIKPDVILLDQIMPLPSVEKCGIPWVLVCSYNPLFFVQDDRLPPAGSGFPVDGDQSEWKHFRDTVEKANAENRKKLNDYLISRGVETLKTSLSVNHSPYLNVYPFPKELDYTDIRPLPPKWMRFDNLKRTDVDNTFEIPEQLRDRPGKLIYFSLGTMGGADVELMKRLTSMMAESGHRFIVSKGPLHDKYELADNMWGQSSVPQIQVLPVVDLVITHGGNNTVTETFFFGKPLIVFPLFVDQFDNAQCIHEKGFGVRLNPYTCSKQELLESVKNLLNDKELKDKLKNISKRIQSENSISKLPAILGDLVHSK